MSRADERFCCDGRCCQGRGCPAFAPGVIDGPHRRSLRRRMLDGLAAFCRWWMEGSPS